ncbi:hypothetical protein ACIBL6_29930 [Streptomyces sp. NPDC050400]|uniref:hypothetical protein n=1 Tax=Streptomyces sp. NPDC050400 TaxID=3365610 RepID=UPI0037AA4726
MIRWRLAGLSLLSAAVLPLATSCSSNHGENAATASPREAASASTPAPATPEQASVEVAPELDEGETLAGHQGATHGGRTLAFKAGKKEDALIIAVRCQGKGELKVALKPVKVSFPLACVDGEVSTTYNQLGVTGVDKEGAVSVTAPSSVHWSMTIGRGEPPEEG